MRGQATDAQQPLPPSHGWLPIQVPPEDARWSPVHLRRDLQHLLACRDGTAAATAGAHRCRGVAGHPHRTSAGDQRRPICRWWTAQRSRRVLDSMLAPLFSQEYRFSRIISLPGSLEVKYALADPLELSW